MIWHALAGALAWYSSSWSGCLARPVTVPVPKEQAIVVRSDWSYEALGKLGKAGWELSSKKLEAGQSLTKAELSAVVARLVDQAARREKAAFAFPMTERVLLARLVAQYGGGPSASSVGGLSPETVPAPNGSRVVKFTPTPAGGEITLVDEKTKKTLALATEGYNYGPTWSDDGDEVAWIHNEGGRSEVWVGSLVSHGDSHLSASFLLDAWGRLTTVKNGFILSLPGVSDRLVRIPALMEPENASARPETDISAK